ncbi:3-methyl-2-oxobutanoate hydroxymethyltransferase [Salibacterium salarium]|uniref:3-methyl-2-oxobutanoate hydroxymethyltransferase n=1 Tax=Salibacterium salarium TaxID=284579 RepID=A0A3R9QLH3_9BACI|nr:3-methyl-2-oxobutanoate hydroxymethyltransferase [Salibacterium salarium]RSL33436.1 3-methyl-2-oxobutanoate hydroxymethyltransferase [Salibacterium salarium]
MKTITSFVKMKTNRDPIAMVTAYDAPTAKAAAKAEMDMILVGDSAGMVVHGYDSTIPVTLDDMVLHSKAVKRGAPHIFTVTDLPFLSYNGEFAETLQSVKRLMQETGIQAVKLEGAGRTLSVIDRLTQSGVPVVGHLGLTPQSVGTIGGYKVQGKTEESANQLVKDAVAIQESGAFALVLECVPLQLASHITDLLTIPVIGIGAGVETDGQVLVFHDIVGFSDGFVPSFVKQYADIQTEMETALLTYVKEVKQSIFPEPQHTFTMNQEIPGTLYKGGEK